VAQTTIKEYIFLTQQAAHQEIITGQIRVLPIELWVHLSINQEALDVLLTEGGP
jgi:hypothetical protein